MLKRITLTISFLCIAFWAISCQSLAKELPQEAPITSAIESKTEQPAYTCADIDSHWGHDWPATIAALNNLIAQGQACAGEPLLSKQYAAYFNYAHSLETSGDIESAIKNYTNAFFIDANRSEALYALIRLNALPEPTSVPCHSDSEPLPDSAPLEMPDITLLVKSQGNQLFLQDRPYKIKGVNYYPRHAPWHRFLQEADMAEVAVELDLIKQTGFNTLRIFLWYDPLFTCQPESAIPNEATFSRVDEMIQLAGDRDLKLIVTLNDLPDLTFRPLYTDWERYDAQTTYIVRRYRNEPVILAWDLRNEGDLDYGARLGDEAKFEKEDVINWLAHISNLVRENDPNHLVTAGWWGNPTITDEYVDILSFHHWHDTLSLQNRINTYRRHSSKPLLLEEIGYHSWQDAPQDRRSEDMQANLLSDAVQVSHTEDIAGWMIWTAFDFAAEPGQGSSYEHYFGLWRSDLTPKPALSFIFTD
jgi:tetratricopeptide (TPR) repeat protein